MTVNTPSELRRRAAALEIRVPPMDAGPHTDDERMWLEKAATLRAQADELERVPTAESVVAGLYEETGLGARPSLVPAYTAAVLALRDRDNAARLRTAGFPEAAAFLEPDRAVIDEAFGPL